MFVYSYLVSKQLTELLNYTQSKQSVKEIERTAKVYVSIYTLRLWHSVRKSMAEADVESADLPEEGFLEWAETMILKVGAGEK